MLMHALEVLCNEPWCCILCWQFNMQFSYATHLAHPVLCRPTHLTFLATLVTQSNGQNDCEATELHFGEKGNVINFSKWI